VRRGRGLQRTNVFVAASVLVASGLLAAHGGMTAAFALDAVAPPVTKDHESEGRLLVLNKGDDSLMVFDEPAHTLLNTIPVGKEPHEVAVTPDGRKAYVANVGDDSLSVVDLAAGKVVRTLRPDLIDQPHGLAVTQDGLHVVVTSEGSHRIYLIDAKRDVVERSITTNQRGSHLVALAKWGTQAWIANRGSDTLSLYELPKLTLVKTVPVGPGPEGIALSPNGRFIVTSLQGAGQVAVVDTGGKKVLTRLPAGQIPIRVIFPSASPMAIVSNRGSDDITFIDVAGRNVIATVPVGRRPGGMAVNGRGTRLYVANNDSGTVSIVSIPGREVSGTIPVGKVPDGLAFVAEKTPVAPKEPGPAKPKTSKGGAKR
jgi:YVTN family beta-propeller protein